MMPILRKYKTSKEVQGDCKTMEPKRALLVNLKDRVRKRKKLYESYNQEKKLMRITQRVIFKLYLKYYNHPDNDIFID
eukprot:UN08799